MLRRRTTRVATSEAVVVGFPTLVGDEVDQLYPRPGWCGRGIGSRLLSRAKEASPIRFQLYTFQVDAHASLL